MGNCTSQNDASSVATPASGQQSSSHGKVIRHDRTKRIKLVLAERDQPIKVDLLILAADPQTLHDPETLQDIMAKTQAEAKIFSKDNMQYFVYQSTLLQVPKATDPGWNLSTVRFNPDELNKTSGSIYAYRSETRKVAYHMALLRRKQDPSFDLGTEFDKIIGAKTLTHEYVTCYQLLDPFKQGEMNAAELEAKLDQEMENGDCAHWFLYPWDKCTKLDSNKEVKYFNHFTTKALQKPNDEANSWGLLAQQGANNTIYVHASTAFESVLHIYEYVEYLWRAKQQIFPTNKESKIGILGGGPSGLLAARKLARVGYTDITIFEKNANMDDPQATILVGKTDTVTKTQEMGGETVSIHAELGTCYMSPSYDHMIQDFDKSGLIQEGQERISFDSPYGAQNGPQLRQVVTGGQFADDGPYKTLRTQMNPNFTLSPTMEISEYTLAKGFDAHYAGQKMTNEERRKKWDKFENTVLVGAVLKYLALHFWFYGMTNDHPFPHIERLRLKTLMRQTIPEFLKEEKLLSLLGILQYGYSVQGYGSTAEDSTMSAYYLLMWNTPPIFFANIADAIKDKIKDALKEALPGFRYDKDWFADKSVVTA